MAANPERGEVDLVVGDRTYVLRPTTNAICALQKRMGGVAYGQLLDRLPLQDVEVWRQLLFSLLQPYHAKEFPNVDKVGDLIDEMPGRHQSAFPIVMEMLKLNRPKRDEPKEGDGPNPPSAQDETAGTGDH